MEYILDKDCLVAEFKNMVRLKFVFFFAKYFLNLYTCNLTVQRRNVYQRVIQNTLNVHVALVAQSSKRQGELGLIVRKMRIKSVNIDR